MGLDMASAKKRRKAAKLSKPKRDSHPSTFWHADGDRRHRGKMTADEALANKRAMQQFGASPPLARDEEE
jgi:hypothetical protein